MYLRSRVSGVRVCPIIPAEARCRKRIIDYIRTYTVVWQRVTFLDPQRWSWPTVKPSYIGPLEHNLPMSVPRLALLEGLYYIVEVKDRVNDRLQLALVDRVPNLR